MTDVDAVRAAALLARRLRAEGVPAGTDRLQAFVTAVGALDGARRRDVYWAGRLTLCGDQDHVAVFDRVFAACFDRTKTADPAGTLRAPADEPAGELGRHARQAGRQAPSGGAASRIEILRDKDLGDMDDEELGRAASLLAELAWPGRRRRTRRWSAARQGAVARDETLRRLWRAGGEPVLPRYRRRRRRPRRIVLLVDVSGSMRPYADGFLRFAHQVRHHTEGTTEVFAIGTRLTRLTRELGHRRVASAMAGVAAAVPDWSGGTRLGARLKTFLDEWGRRGLARGAVVVILSDGWEQGDTALLGEQMARLGRLASHVVWANPRKGRPGYRPLAAGMAAALPHVDDFVEGHSIEALRRLARIVAGRSDPAPARCRPIGRT